MGCLECGKELVQLSGKRAKQFCNVTCRSNYWQKKKRKASAKPPGVPGRPKKKSVLHIDVKEMNNEVFDVSVGVKTSVVKELHEGTFMGVVVPEGLKGIDLSIWKAEIKDKSKFK